MIIDVFLVIIFYILFVIYCYQSRQYRIGIYCDCWGVTSQHSLCVNWLHSASQMLHKPSWDNWSEVCFVTAYLHSYLLITFLQSFGFANKLAYIGLPGDSQYLNLLKIRYMEHLCIQGTSPKGHCHSHYYSDMTCV